VKPLGRNWRTSRISALLSSKEAADLLGIKQRPLLNIESDQPRSNVSELLVAKAADLYKVPIEFLAVANERIPDEPPSKEQDQETNTGPGRRDGDTRGDKDNRGPKRFSGAAA
jgi:transcriptional regulator with XRE-family HTH domain